MTKKADIITKQEEIFCKELNKTGNKSASFRIAFPKSKLLKESTVNEKACLLSKKSKILSRLEALRIETLGSSKHKISEAADVLEYLSKTMENENETTANRLKAAELLAKKHKLLTDKVESIGVFAGVTQININRKPVKIEN